MQFVGAGTEGVDASGLVSVSGTGAAINIATSSVKVGGTATGAGNVISGRSDGIVFAAAPTVLPNGRLIVSVLSRRPAAALPAAWVF